MSIGGRIAVDGYSSDTFTGSGAFSVIGGTATGSGINGVAGGVGSLCKLGVGAGCIN